MAIKKTQLATLEPWQVAYLMSDGRRLNYSDFNPDWLGAIPFWKLYDGRCPIFLNSEKAAHPFNLWREHGSEHLAEFRRRHPGKMPLPWWTWCAPGAADPADQGRDPAKYQKAIVRAQRRARWPAEKQTEFLQKHGLKK